MCLLDSALHRWTVASSWVSIKCTLALILDEISAELQCVTFIIRVNIKVKFTLFWLVSWVTFKWIICHFTIEFHLFKSCATSLVIIYRISQATLAVFSILFEIFFRGILSIIWFPTESSAMVLTVYRHASLSIFLAVFFIWVPAKLVILTLVVSLTDLKFTTLDTACGFEWPINIYSTVKIYIAIKIIHTMRIFVKTHTHIFSLITVTWPALKPVVTKSSREKILS